MAGWGGGGQLPAGDYYHQITDVKTAVSKLKTDSGQENKPQYQFECDAYMPDGKWQKNTVWTSQNFTPPDREATTRMVSSLNRLTRAVNLSVPTSAEEAASFEPKDLMPGRGFILRIEQDPETPSKFIKRFLRIDFPSHRAVLPPNIAQVAERMGMAVNGGTAANGNGTPAAPTQTVEQLQAQLAALQAQAQAAAPVAAGVAGDQDDYAN